MKSSASFISFLTCAILVVDKSWFNESDASVSVLAIILFIFDVFLANQFIMDLVHSDAFDFFNGFTICRQRCYATAIFQNQILIQVLSFFEFRCGVFAITALDGSLPFSVYQRKPVLRTFLH